MSTEVRIKNKKAAFEYHLLEKYVAGIVLRGSEIKSIRMTKASIQEAYCLVIKGELWIRNMHIDAYKDASYNNHEPKRDRKLLLQRQEIAKIDKKLKTKGATIVPVSLFINGKGLAKIEIAVATGKKLHDKRQDLRLKDDKRSIDREIKRNFK